MATSSTDRTIEVVDAELRKVHAARAALRSALEKPPPGTRGTITARIDSLDTSIERLLDERLGIASVAVVGPDLLASQP